MLIFTDTSPATVSRGTGHELGGARLGSGSPQSAVDWPEQVISAPLLGAAGPWRREIWSSGEACIRGTSGDVRWSRTADLLFGVIELDEERFATGAEAATPLQRASESAYAQLFQLLDTQSLPYLWRVWNYLPDITGVSHGLERYQQFNIGRQDAFVSSRRSATGNVPAACAIGLAEGPLSIAFLAGALPATPIENPRQVSAYNYPIAYGPRSPTFSRATLVYPAGQEILFISGTASILGHQTVHAGDVAAQCREAMANIEAVVAEANRSCQSAPYALTDLQYRVYLRTAGDFPCVRDTLTPSIGSAEIIYVQADICRTDLLLEIEATAIHPRPETAHA